MFLSQEIYIKQCQIYTKIHICSRTPTNESAVYFNFLLTDATDRSKFSSDQKRLFFAVSLYPLLFFANTPFKSILLLLLPSFIPHRSSRFYFSCFSPLYPPPPSCLLYTVRIRGKNLVLHYSKIK